MSRDSQDTHLSPSHRPNTPNHKRPSSSGHSDHSQHPQQPSSSNAATSTVSHSSDSNSNHLRQPGSNNGLSSTTCSACGKPMQGPFVRALGAVFHLNCFKCMDCGDVVASKFFPIDAPNGKQSPLCERDYFRRLNLICAKCGMALRGSYITACNKKYHVEHFTCSLCSTLFGPQDSYYEHDGDVYCHFHYSTRFATKCAGCSSAILKQFVEINRNMRDECWHPECYMINKFWNVKVSTRRPTSSVTPPGSADGEQKQLHIQQQSQLPAYMEEEQRETPASLKEKQVRMEQQVYRIWTVLSAFEESSAACISDMLRQVSNGAYLDAIRMAEKFILHVEVLFGTIDDLEWIFAGRGVKGMAHVREARMLCRKTVELFTLLSHTQETGARRMGMTQELLALVTGLAHYLKILIRIALTGALKLERGEAGGSQALVFHHHHHQQQQHGAYRSLTTTNGAPPLAQGEAMAAFLDKLHLLAVQGGNPAARRTIKSANSSSSSTTLIPTPTPSSYNPSSSTSLTHPYPYLAPNGDPLNLNPMKNPGTQGVTYGFRSLAPEYAGESPFWGGTPSSSGDGGSSPGGSGGGGGSTASGTAGQSSSADPSFNHAGPSSSGGSGSSSSSPPSDLCVRCGLTVEEDCVRLGTYQRWHSHCVQCAHCGKIAAVPAPQAPGQTPQQQAHGRKDGGGRSRDGQRSGDEGMNATTTMSNGKDLSTSTSASGSTSQPTAPKLTTLRRPPARVHEFVYDPDSLRDTPPFGEVPTVILCTEHAHPRCRGGFQAVQRLEQYAFLLNVALRRLYLLLKKQGVVPMSPVSSESATPTGDPYRNSGEIMKSAHLDRKLSSTTRFPKRSTIIESPTGRSVHPSPSNAEQQQQQVVQQYQPQLQYQQQQYGQYGQQQPQQPPQRGYEQQQQGAYYAGGGSPQIPQYQGSSSSSSSPPSQHNTPRAGPARLPLDSQGQGLRPSLGRSNTDVMSVDDAAPSSPSGMDDSSQQGGQGYQPPLYPSQNQQQYQQSYQQQQQQQLYQYHQQQQQQQQQLQQQQHVHQPGTLPKRDDALTLADIPQLMEVAQAREQQRSLPREGATPFIAELSALELAIVKHSAVLALMRSPLKDHVELDEILEMIESKKSGFWNKLFKGDKKNVKKKGVFGIPLELLVEKEGSDSLLGATRATLRVPSFIDDVISAMRQMDMSIEGIFRKNGNIRRLRDLTDAIDRDPSSVDLSQDNPVQLAALLKKFLRELPDPLMTFKLHRLFVASQSLPSFEERKRYLHLISLIMPKSHRDTMEVLFVFLKWVASFAHMDAETGSKMDLENLAKVICPSILYARGRDPLRDETLSGVHVVTLLLENQDEFFTVPEDFLTILHDQEYFANSMDLPSKEFLKKCDTYMRVKGGGGGSNGRSMPGTPYLNQQSNGAQQQQPRYPQPMSSPVMERPPPPPGSGGSFAAGPSNASERNNTRSDSYPPPGSSPPISQGMQQQSQGIVQNMQRTPQMDDWSPTPPALPRDNRSRSPSSRPSSFVGPASRPAGSDPSQQHQQQLSQAQGLPYNHPAVMNGYPSAAAAAAGGGRQRL
ncbi:hypothetical protein M413DRAFT_367036 [Hebeloma cylindrosporum]|uniref:RhoGAP-domain-containing protein n=1 Tax=Hebeloma cylindrosporum TaxID=76867 RepID=A0A0C3C7W3_HEBCY|nr:hypothetical protein M413DRAFT_367036 [Hebeloma cylindrosporum h7]